MHSVLVVDDDPSIREMLRVMLTFSGYEVTEAGDGMEALVKAREAQPDVMILDVMLPRMCGIDVCKTLRQENSTSTLPIIMLSARTDRDDVARGMAAGATKYMGKPMCTQELLNSIENLANVAC